jgi:hypothetical protein
MKINIVVSIICLGITFMFCNQARSEFRLNTDTNYSIKIAVTVNENDNIVGKLEYSEDWLQLVTFTRMGDIIHAEPYLFEIIERTIVSEYIHKVRLRSLNDKYSAGEVTGAIDFRDEVHPKVRLVTTGLVTYIGNISEKGKKMHKKYIPNVWLGQ